MRSVVLKKGSEEPWASERVASFIFSLGYKEITLKSDTELSIIAFRNRVAENSNADVTLKNAEQAFKPPGRKRSDVVACCHQNHQVSCGELHRRRTPGRLPDLAVVGRTCRRILSKCQKGRDGRTPFERLQGKKPTQEFVPFGEKVLARPISSEPLNRMNPRYKFGVWMGVRNNSAECYVGTAEGVFRAREVRRIEHQDRWTRGELLWTGR